MADHSHISCGSDDDEVFFGENRTIKELVKATQLGQNYYSPIGNAESTPRPRTDCHPCSLASLPDVINGSSSSSKYEESSESLLSNTSTTSPQNSTSNDSDNVIIIDLDDQNDSIQVISDDDSLDENCQNNESNIKINNFETMSLESFEVQQVKQESVSEESIVANHSSDQQRFKSEPESIDNTIERAALENYNILPKNEEINSDVSLPVEELKLTSDTRDTGNNMNVNSSGYSIAALIEASNQLNNECTVPIAQDSKMGMNSFAVEINSPQKDALNNLNYSLITGESDSILNISHGSSLSSPTLALINKSSLGLLTSAVYEDVSYDGDSLVDLAEEASKKPQETMDDLQMSVDETDFVKNDRDENSTVPKISTVTSLFKSCLSDGSSYYTAYNTVNVSGSQMSFSNYREALDDSAVIEGVDKANNDEVGEENVHETSFEMVVQNRQNSFTGMANTSVPITSVESTTDLKNTILTSKLPKYNFSSNLLKPSQLKIKPKSDLSKKTYVWAKNLSVSDSGKTKSSAPCSTPKSTPKNHTKTSSAVSKTFDKVLKSTDKTPSKNLVVQKTTRVVNSDTKIPSARKDLCGNKTPAKNFSCAPAKLVKSETKTAKTLTFPNKNTASSDTKGESKGLLLEKGRYKDVISPVRAYISGTPVILQRPMRVPEAHTSGQRDTHIPVPSKIPVGGSSTPFVMKSSKAIQKLKYGLDQENMDPNNTLPSRIFKPSAAVFMKEPEPPKRYLPKMGETMTKLVDTPRPKVTHHQGRVKESPKAKGMLLLPSIKVNTPGGHYIEDIVSDSDTRISVRVVKPAEDSTK